MCLGVTGTGAGDWDVEDEVALSVFRKGMVPCLCLMVPLAAMQRINCRVLRLVRRPFCWVEVVAESERWRVILDLF